MCLTIFGIMKKKGEGGFAKPFSFPTNPSQEAKVNHEKNQKRYDHVVPYYNSTKEEAL